MIDAGLIGGIGLSSGLEGGYGVGVSNTGYRKTAVVDQNVSVIIRCRNLTGNIVSFFSY